MQDSIKFYFCFHKKFLLYNLVARNLKIKYRESFLGYLWTMIIPICQTAIFYFLYSMVFKIDVPHYLLFLVCGLLPWFFFSATLAESMESVGGHGALLNQMPIPIQVFPNMSALTNMFNLLAATPIIAFVYFMSDLSLHLGIFLIFPLLFFLYMIALSLGIMLSIVYVFFRDLRHITNLVLQIWFYLTPVVYSREMMPETVRDILIYCNPVAGFFISLRSILLGDVLDLRLYSLSGVWALFLFLVSYLVLRRYGSGLVEKL